MNNQDFDFLTESEVKIIQARDGYRFTSDAVALANFAKCRNSDIVFDVGCGGGVIALIIADKDKPKKIVAVDIREEAAQLTRRNVEINGMQERIEVHCADVREFHTKIGANTADVIVCNPPYFSAGRKSIRTDLRTARHDEILSLEELALSATRLIRYGGLLYICFPAKSTARAVSVLENNNFRIRHIKFLTNNKGIYLVLIKAKKGGGHGTAVEVV